MMPVTKDMNVQEPPNYLNVKERKKTPSPSPANDSQNRRAFIVAGVCIGLVCIEPLQSNYGPWRPMVTIVFIPICAIMVEPLVNKISITGYYMVAQMNCDNHTLSVVTKQLRSKYGRLVKEKKQLNTNYINLGKARDPLQKERDEIQKRLSNLAGDIRKRGWIIFRSSLYYMSAQQRSWDESRQDRRQRGADLVIINSREEQEFTERLIRGKIAWIRLSDREKEGERKWVDGAPLTIAYWFTRESNNSEGKEHCVATGLSPEDFTLLNKWNDNSCSIRNFWICEKTISI